MKSDGPATDFSPEKKSAPESAAECGFAVGIVYTELRRRRRIAPNPSNALPRSARLAGSGTEGGVTTGVTVTEPLALLVV